MAVACELDGIDVQVNDKWKHGQLDPAAFMELKSYK